MPRVIYVKPHRRGKAVVKAHKRRSILRRLQSIADRHQKASVLANSLPDPRTGIYGMNRPIDQAWRRMSSGMKGGAKVSKSKWRRLYAKAMAKSGRKFPY